MKASSAKELAGHLLHPDVPEPVLFNTWKHHAASLRGYIREYSGRGEAGLAELATQVVVLGFELMDLYFGPLTPEEIAAAAVAWLRGRGLLSLEAYTKWLDDNGGYAVIPFEQDGSQWVVRMGLADGRHVHVHPGRWVPQTRRVRANVLKTAVLVNAYALVHGGDPFDVALVNEVRRQYLDLSPMRAVVGDQGLHPVIELLRPAGG